MIFINFLKFHVFFYLNMVYTIIAAHVEMIYLYAAEYSSFLRTAVELNKNHSGKISKSWLLNLWKRDQFAINRDMNLESLMSSLSLSNW